MAMINPFTTDGFSLVALTDAINVIPNMYGKTNELGLFTEKGVRTRTVIVDEKNGVLNLLPTRPVGAPGTEAIKGRRKVRSFVIPHIPHEDAGDGRCGAPGNGAPQARHHAREFAHGRAARPDSRR